MEGAIEVNDTVEGVVEDVPIGVKDNNAQQIQQQPKEQSSSKGNAALQQLVTEDADWPEPFSLLQSFGTLNANTDGGNISGNAEEKVEELTLQNVISPDFPGSSGSYNREKPAVQRSFWGNFARLAGRAGNMVLMDPSVVGSGMNISTFPLSPGKSGLLQKEAYEQHVDVDQHLAASNSHSCFFNRMHNNGTVLAYSMGSSASKGKEIAFQCSHDTKGEAEAVHRHKNGYHKADETSNYAILREGATTLFEGGSGLDSQDEGTSLRELLIPSRQKISKTRKITLFKKIVGLVEISHSQGLALQHLQPSFFNITASDQVRYTGSYVTEDLLGSVKPVLNMGDYMRRKRPLTSKTDLQDGFLSLTSKHQKVGDHRFGDHECHTYAHNNVREIKRGEHIGSCVSNTGISGYTDLEPVITEPYSSNAASCLVSSSNPSLRGAGFDMRKLENRWYSAPEESSECSSPFSSNIYSLGVLLFELLCCFDTWEVRSAAMSDLRYRILPPQFLLDCPKEAGFCLLLLHPDPFSRPKAKDILSCDIICEDQDILPHDNVQNSVDEENMESELLLLFLLSCKEEKEQRARKLAADVEFLQADILEIEKRKQLQFGCNETTAQMLPELSHSTYKDRLTRHLDKLENAYYTMRSTVDLENTVMPRVDNSVLKMRDQCGTLNLSPEAFSQDTDRLGDFFESLCKYARYSKFELRGCLKNTDMHSSHNVICSLNFDRDEEYFATAGISKKIKIFEFASLLNKHVDIHYPLVEMVNRSKLSWVCWNNYIKNYIASTDYEGIVKLWDASTGQGFGEFKEHRKRAWSVDFSKVDPRMLASGSDDCSVKIWNINEKNCVDTITFENPANVCCVQYSPHSSHMLAFGAVNYKVYCYDLRNTRIPWCTIGGHGKAVSYVRFVDSETLVSASTDSTLKIWDLNHTDPVGVSTGACSQTLTGHTNEKNFVGLSVYDGYVACGSEKNEVYAYYKSFPMPVTSHRFGSADLSPGQETHQDDNSQFVSSVCWTGKSNMVVAANSIGSIEVLELV